MPTDDQLRAQAAIRRRKRAGKWQGGVVPHTEYQDKPLEWITKYLDIPEHTLRWSINSGYRRCTCASEVCQGGGEHEWDGDPDPLVQILDGLANWEDTGAESGTGTGKTYLAGAIVLWFIACHEDSLVITVAPKEEQLLSQVWKEIGGHWSKFQREFPQADLVTGRLRMKPTEERKEKWAALALVAGVGADEEVANKMAGFHAQHMLFITEETQGIDPAIMTAIDATRTDDHNLHLALGNPDHRQDQLHRFCTQGHVRHVRISAYDHPNVVTSSPIVPGAIGRKRLEQRIEQYGKGSRLYQSRVRGISPAQAEDALIRREWCEAAVERGRDKEWRQQYVEGWDLGLGIDVADIGNDKSAFARWQGALLTEVESFREIDASAVGVRAYHEIMDPHDPVDVRYVGIDSVGVGASTVNKLRELGLKIRHISGGKRSVPGLDEDLAWSEVEPDLEGVMRAKGPRVVQAERFDNLRSQVWWRMREDLRLGRVGLPYDEGLIDDLTAPTFETTNGVIRVQKKKDIRKVIGRSPDKGDAAVMGNFVRRRRPNLRRTVPDEQTENRDVGLEKFLARHERERRKHTTKMKRLLKGKRAKVYGRHRV